MYSHRSINSNNVDTPRDLMISATSKIKVNSIKTIKKQKHKEEIKYKNKENLHYQGHYFRQSLTSDYFQSNQEKVINKKVSQIKEWKIQHFQILKQMGKGKFGQVLAAKDIQSDYLVALKKMSKKQLIENNFVEQSKREIIIQSSLNHVNILKLFGYFWDEDSIYLILQYAPGGELYKCLQKQQKMNEKNTSIIIRQTCLGLEYLHKRNIIHRDIKPENILVSGSTIKIADFGWSIKSNRKRETLCGTLDYLAPEMVKGQLHDKGIDIWGVGILCYELLFGRPPFEMESYDETYHMIVNNEVFFPGEVSSEAKALIKKCLHKTARRRITLEEIFQEPFIAKYQNDLLHLQ